MDHCFPIKGKGTVATGTQRLLFRFSNNFLGTVLQGKVSVKDEVFIPHLNTEKMVKDIQMFKEPVETAGKGDRVGLLLTQFDAKSMERGLICAKGNNNRTRFFKR